MKGTLTLTDTLEDCVVGESKTIQLVVTPTANDDATGFTADVDEVVDYEEGSKEEGAGKPYPAKDKPASGVTIMISSGKKK